MSYSILETRTQEEFVQKATATLKQEIFAAIRKRGSCIIGLSGGSTPKPVYEELGQENLPWSNVFLFLTDERCVPPNHPESNQKLIRDTLLKYATIPESNLTFPDTTLPIERCIDQYTQRLKKLWKNFLPDIVVLGMGTDGHIASLFPPLTQNLMDDTQLVAHTTTDRFEVPSRITLTLNPLLAAQTHVLLLRGEEKKKTWTEMLRSPGGEERWPAKAVLTQEHVYVVTCWSTH